MALRTKKRWWGVVLDAPDGVALADYQPQDNVRVFLDPAGHPFCLYVSDD